MNCKKDDELVKLCLNGDSAAWASMHERYERLVFRICHLSSISDQDADDLAQEAFIKIWMNLPSYNPERGCLGTWIASVTRNLRVERFRRRKKERLTDSLDEGWEDSGVTPRGQRVVDSRPTPHASVFSNEVRAIIYEATEKISPVAREAVILRIVHELNDFEISRKLCIPEGTVKSRVHRGRNQVASLLNPLRDALGLA